MMRVAGPPATMRLFVLGALLPGAAGYHSLGAGACRGAGGANDKVNARHKAGLTKSECEAACDAIPADGSDGICAGYAHKASAPSECILYGPGMAGDCASPNDATMWKEVCEAIGTCGDVPSSAASENECGTCSDGSAIKENACASVSGTWSKGAWTQTGVWELSAEESGWTGEFHHTDHIHSITANAQYECFDKDVTDHVGKCSDGAGATGCAAAFAAADTYESDSCPTGCTWTDAPVSPTPKPAHPAVADVTGYSYLSGACRSTSPANLADSSATPMQDRPAYMYTKNTEFPSFPAGLSPAELAATCDQINADHAADSLANPAQCLGFHSGPWVSLFGKNIDKAGPHLKAGWAGWDEGSGTTDLTGTKPNHQYVCFIRMTNQMWVLGPAGLHIYNADGSSLVKELPAADFCEVEPTSRGTPGCSFKDVKFDGEGLVWATNTDGGSFVEAINAKTGAHVTTQPSCGFPYYMDIASYRKEVWVHCWSPDEADGDSGHVDVYSMTEPTKEFAHIPLEMELESHGHGLVLTDAEMGDYAYGTLLDTPAIFKIDANTKQTVKKLPIADINGLYRASFSPMNKHLYLRSYVCCTCGLDGDTQAACSTGGGGPKNVSITTGPSAGTTAPGSCGHGCEGSAADVIGVIEYDVVAEKQVATWRDANGRGANPYTSPYGDYTVLLANDGASVRVLEAGANGGPSKDLGVIELGFSHGGTAAAISDVAFIEDETHNIVIFSATTDNFVVLVDMASVLQGTTADAKTKRVDLQPDNAVSSSSHGRGAKRVVEWVRGTEYVWVNSNIEETIQVIGLSSDGDIDKAAIVREINETKSAHMVYVGPTPRLAGILARRRGWRSGKPDFFPDGIPAPLSYYYLDEGMGMALTEHSGSAVDKDAGRVVVIDEHQLHASNKSAGATHQGANWLADEYFGTSIACGKIDDSILQKDTLAFKDVDYGSGGSWAWSVWFRHEKDVNFPDYQREQFFGHGNPIFPTTSNDQVHIQFEKSGSLRTILYDKKDYTRFTLDCMQEHCYPDGATVGDPPANPHCYKEFANGTRNQAAYDCWRAGATSASTDTDAAIRDYDNGLWHNLVLTTKAADEGGGKGFNLYVDGVLRSASPFIDGVGQDKGYADNSYLNHLGVGGDPINPDGEIRLCGRAKPAVWTDDDADKSEVWFDERRYFRGKVAHFSLWSSALSQSQVSALHKAYVDKYKLTVTPFEMPAHIPPPLAYYYMDEGHGFDLKESMSQDPNGGKVRYLAHHQLGKDGATAEYSQPNWVHDAHFGRTIACGEISNKTHPELGTQQKDFITLADVDYGHNGQWAMAVWYRHEQHVNFDNYQREQFFGHGNAVFPTTARNQVHIQFEKDDGILAILKDGVDWDRFSCDCMKDFCPADYEELKKVPECFKWYPNTTTTNPEAYKCYKACKDSASFETRKLGGGDGGGGSGELTDNGMWHHLVVTTKGWGKGTNLYVDGKLEAASPYTCTSDGCIGIDKGNSGPEHLNRNGVGGDPIDPEGDMRLCGRLKGGAIWPGGDPALPGGSIDAEETEFDPRRYFRGQVAHFALWDAPLSHTQVNALLDEYRKLYKLPAYSRLEDDPEAVWRTKAKLAGWTEPPTPSCNVDDHHSANGGFYVEGINGVINDERDLESGKRADDGTWEPNRYYPHGEGKLCTGLYCSAISRVEPQPQYVTSHTCARLRFTYGSDSDVWELPSQEALDACDFSSAILRGAEGAGELDILYDYNHAHKFYFYASRAGCALGQKVAVKVVEDYEDNFAQCKGMGAGSSRIQHCDCNHQLKPSTLIDPCHTAFVYGCLADMPDDLSCCPDEGTTYDAVTRSYVAPEGGRTGRCIAKSHLAAAAEKVPELKQIIAAVPVDPKLAEYAAADCPPGGYYGPPKDPLCDLYKAYIKCKGDEKPDECAYDENWVAFAASESIPPLPSGPHFKDDTGEMHEWSAAKPKVLTGAFTAITLMHMGLDPDQIYGTFGDRTTSGSNVGGVYADGNEADHGDHAAAAYDKLNFPADPNEEERAMLAKAHDLSEDCSASNFWCATFNMALLDEHGWPDVIVQGPYNDPSVVTAEVKAAAVKRGIPIIAITSSYSTEDAPPKGFIEIAHRFAELAAALGATDVDAAAWADKAALRDAVGHFKKASRRAASKGLKALAGYIPYGEADDNGDVGAFLASPDKDPVLLMLEELGMPIMHTDVAQKDNWEYMLTPGMKMSATNLMSSGSRTGGRLRVPYPADFFLYDVRVTLDFTSDAFAAAWPHPALVAKQYAYWPSNGHIFSYRHAATILELVGEKLMVAEPLHGQENLAKSGCVNVEVPDDHIYRTTGLAPGDVACYNPVSYTWLDGMTAPPPPHPPSPPPAKGTFTDGDGKTHTWHASKPKIVTGAFQALTLIDMGLDPAQIIGTFGERATSGSNVDGVYADYNQADHGDHADAPYDPSHFLTDPSPEEKALLANMYDASPGCSGSNNWCSDFDVAVMDANGWPDVIIAGPLFEKWVVLNKAEVVAGAAARGVPIIIVEDQTTSKLWKSFIELAEDFERLAQALGADTEAATANDKAMFCTHAARFAQVASAAQERGVRALAGVIPYGAADPETGDIGAWLQTPDRNPALTMLEALGMQILHTETGYSGAYYEGRTKAKMSATDLKSASGAADYSVDFFLYDPRTALDIVSDAFAAAWPHPAIVAKQYAPYPITTLHYSYRHAWKVLESVGSKLEAAIKVDPAETTCTAVDLVEGEHYRTSGLAPGAYACVAQPIKYDWCLPFRLVELEGKVAALEKAAQKVPDDDDDGFTGGTVAGIAVGTLIGGVIIGAIVGVFVSKSSQQSFPPPRGKELETRTVEKEGPTVSAV